jgi:isopenicillin N synthase-like dioxygenase
LHPKIPIPEQSKQFFDLPLDVKRQVAWETPESNRGWVELGREKLTEMDKHGASREDISALREAQPDRKEVRICGEDGNEAQARY